MPELQDPDIFRTILESLQTGVYVVGREGRILFWNQGAEKITGYLRHEALGRFCRENVLSHCNDHNCVQCGVSWPIAVTLHEGKSSQGEIFFRNSIFHSAFCTSVSSRWTSSVPPMAARQPRPFSM